MSVVDSGILADQKRTAQLGSVRQLTQAHQVRLLLTQNRSLPSRCSTTTTGSPAIWFARRFFALLERGVRVTVIGPLRLRELYHGSGAVAHPPGGSLPVGVFSDDHPILANLTVSVFFGEIQAQIPSKVGVGGLILPRSGGADNIKAGHDRGCRWLT